VSVFMVYSSVVRWWFVGGSVWLMCGWVFVR